MKKLLNYIIFDIPKKNKFPEKIGCCSCTVSKVLKDKNISIRFGRCKKIDQFDLDGHYI